MQDLVAKVLGVARDPRPLFELTRAAGARALTPLTYRRRFQAFCVGGPKTGTHSIASMFEKSYRSRHEPEPYRFVPWIEQARSGRMSRGDLCRQLLRRDRRLWLELESSHFLGLCVEDLVECFPNARFILTVRDCYSWLNSWLNQENSRRQLDPWWDRLRELRFGDARHCPPEEARLREAGLAFSLDGYLADWESQIERVTSAVPADRLLIVATPRISASAAQIARFVGVPEHTLAIEASHAYRGKRELRAEELVDTRYLREKFARCEPLMRRYLPDYSPPF